MFREYRLTAKATAPTCRRPVSFPVAAGVGFVSSEFPFNFIDLAIIIKCVRVDHKI